MCMASNGRKTRCGLQRYIPFHIAYIYAKFAVRRHANRCNADNVIYLCLRVFQIYHQKYTFCTFLKTAGRGQVCGDTIPSARNQNTITWR
jgi:hypothetical protein